jgi:hypothetical protein
MGLFDWLRGKPRLRTIVWFDEATRLRGVVDATRADVAAGRHVVVVAHFADSLVEVGQHLAAAGIPFDTIARWQSRDTQQLAASPARVVAILARALPADDGSAPPVKAGGKTTVAVRACELHVLPAENERVLTFANRLPVAAEATAHLSLTNPILARLMNPAIAALMAKMGMDNGKPIDSSMVSRAVDRTLAKLAKRVTGDAPATSLGAWVERNLPRR